MNKLSFAGVVGYMPAANPPLRVLVADDEPLARKRLIDLLSREAEVELVAECTNGTDAEAAIRNLAPDVALLDVQMPGLDGLAVARTLTPGTLRPVIIFVTAYEEHALRAFELQAADYVMKPCPPARLHQALNRARALLSSEPASTDSQTLQRLIVRASDRMIVVSAEDVEWIESANNYVILHVGRETHVLRQTLTELEHRLPKGQFLRISRTAIVNLSLVREIRQDDGGHAMVLRGGESLPITRGIREVQARLEVGA
ncbi:MAG: LytTR family DNA-binding domain-containing protein [Nibricoccus sp.]